MENLQRSDNMFDLTKEQYISLIDKLMLNEELSKILEMKIKKESNTKIAMTLHLSDRTLARRIKELKRKIDRVL